MKNTFRTSNNVFRTQVQNYIMDSLSQDSTLILDEQLQNTVEAFNNWYGPYEQRRTQNRQKAFTEWLMCLPSELSIAYSYYEISNLLEQWFTNCNQPYEQRNNEPEFFLNIVYMNFQRLCKKHNVDF